MASDLSLRPIVSCRRSSVQGRRCRKNKDQFRGERMAQQRLGIIMNGVTGRMGMNQHLIRSICAIRDAGRRGAEERRPGDARSDPGRAQRRAGGEARQGPRHRALDHRSRQGAEGQEGHAVLRRRHHAASRRAAEEGDEGRQGHLLREAGVGHLEGRARSGPRREEGQDQARRGAGQAVPARPAQAQDADRLRLLRPHPLACAASSATGCSRATGSRRSGRRGTTRRPRAAASSSTWCATGATCSTTCSAMSRA